MGVFEGVVVLLPSIRGSLSIREPELRQEVLIKETGLSGEGFIFCAEFDEWTSLGRVF